MTLEEFYKHRRPFFIDDELLTVRFPTQRHANGSCADWFTESSVSWCHTLRGYYWEDSKESFAMIYWNDYDMPNVTMPVISYLFEKFPNIEWVGIGCHKGIPGEIWKPKFKVFREN